MRWPPATWTALPWLDWRLLRNRARMIARSPRRLVPWLLFLVLLVPNLVSRLMVASAARRNPGVEPFAMVLNAVGHYVPGVALVVLGLALWQAGGRPPAAFQSPADGRFLVGAGMPSRLVLTWLALRRARRLLLAGFFYLVLLAVSVPGNGLSGAQLVAGTAGLTAYLWLIFGARVVLFAVQTKAPGASLGWVGLAVAVLGVVTLGAAVGGLDASGPLNALPPGSWLDDAFQGRLLAAGLLAAVAVALAVGGTLAADDCLPELWAASSRAFEIRRMVRRGNLSGLRAATRRQPGDRPATAAS
ncbi:MAG TPA: putative ABC exporter domain-containing protein, partial [Candidatus Dormibacteraeota bacterium]|nr:putative ABC exporter domain-containing protein [Candidatus Dormibacteraeota bacterium]